MEPVPQREIDQQPHERQRADREEEHGIREARIGKDFLLLGPDPPQRGPVQEQDGAEGEAPHGG
jgi:hypothetical protein